MSTTEQAVVPRSANPFGGTGVVGSEAAGAGVVAAQARELAETQTKYLMAEKFPRDERKAMDNIITAFSRVGMAECAEYQYGRGGTDIKGPSIHAAQAIAQQWGNIEMGWRELSRGIGPDGVPFSEVDAYAIDLQGRVPSRIQFIVRHWRDTKSGGYKLKDERDIYELCANMAQRRKRACILAIVPQDVIDAAMDQADVTLKTKADTSPEAMTKMVAAFAPFGVTKEHIEKRIQRRIDTIGAAQVVQLKRIYASLRDEMSRPEDWFEIAPEQAQPAGGGSRVQAAKDALKGAGAKESPAQTGEKIPHFDQATAAAALKEARTLEALDAKWKEICDDFLATNRSRPIDLDGAYNDRKEALKQGAGK